MEVVLVLLRSVDLIDGFDLRWSKYRVIPAFLESSGNWVKGMR